MRIIHLAITTTAAFGFVRAAPKWQSGEGTLSMLQAPPPNTTNQDQFNSLELFAEFAAAAYKRSNIDSFAVTPRPLTCPITVCPKLNVGTPPTIVRAGNMPPMVFFSILLNGFDIPAQYYVALDRVRSLVVVAFEGTDLTTLDRTAFGQLLQDLAAALRADPFNIPNCTNCYVISSFLNSWRGKMFEINTAVNGILDDPALNRSEFRVVFTGHSLGGALAAVGAAESRARFSYGASTPIDLYTYGAPAVGNNRLAVVITTQNQNNQNTSRVTHRDDYIPVSNPRVSATTGRTPLLQIPYLGFGFPTDQYSPEYFITVPTTTPVTPANILDLRPNIVNDNVVASDFGSKGTTINANLGPAHQFYIIPITCIGC